MHVVIDPILTPKRYALNLYVDNFVTDLLLVDISDVDSIQATAAGDTGSGGDGNVMIGQLETLTGAAERSGM